jgi:hypothetical protein
VRNLIGNFVDFCSLLFDDMLFNLANVGVDFAQDIVLRLCQFPQKPTHHHLL